MRIRKYDFNFSRRHFMSQTAKGILGAGVFGSVWDAVAQNGTFEKVYPDELLSIGEYTKGKVTPGVMIDADNVDLIQDLLDPIRYTQIKQMGRKLQVVESVKDMTRLSPVDYIEATLRNKDQAMLDEAGNVWTKEGKPWIGGNPFPEPSTGAECFIPITLSWGRHDISFYAIKDYEIADTGEQTHHYEVCWCEYASVGRVSIDPKPYLPGSEDKLRYQSVFFTYPNDAKGTSFLNIWDYDQRKFPELMGFLPAFKRVRRFPSSQRFEPLIPGTTLYLSDAWTAGDPYLTWGNYNIIGRGPFLAGLSGNWNSAHDNWQGTVHGGPKGITFWDTKVELIPEVIVVEAEPTGYPRAPISKKRVWFDARTMLPVGMVTYDRRGEPFKSFDGCYSMYEDGDKKVNDFDGRPYWSWCNVHAHDVQSNRMTRLEQVKSVGGGYQMRVNDESMFDQYLTEAAIRRLGT
ncbi:MAG: DUF1329 domain-containing protein [Gammaproteobacteria bacterium]|nr:DUF1329 domain-containing protein [Gammaproteobacteria bacterium]